MTPNWGEMFAMHDDGAAIQRDFVTVNTVPIWSFIQGRLLSPTLVKEEPLAVVQAGKQLCWKNLGSWQTAL